MQHINVCFDLFVFYHTVVLFQRHAGSHANTCLSGVLFVIDAQAVHMTCFPSTK